MITKCRYNIIKYLNTMIHNIVLYYIEREMIPTVCRYTDVLVKKHAKGLIKYSKSKGYITD